MTFKERLGIALALFALASMVLFFAGLNFRFFVWIDMWGPLAGWGIRIGLLIYGIYLYRTGDEIE